MTVSPRTGIARLVYLLALLTVSPALADSLGAVGSLPSSGSLATQAAPTGPVASRLVTLHGLRGSEYWISRDALVHDLALSREELIALTDHGDWRVRETAAMVFGWRTDPELFEAIHSALPVQARSGRQDFRDEAFSRADSRAAVVERLLHAADAPSVRAGVALHLVGKGEGWGRLAVHILAEEGSAEVRVALLWMLRHASEEPAMDGAHLGMLDGDAVVRAQACRTAGFHDAGAVLVPELLRALDDDDGQVRGDAARSLGWLRAEDAADALVPGLSDPVADVRLHTLRAISRLDPSGTSLVPWLISLVDDPDSRVARLARRLSEK